MSVEYDIYLKCHKENVANGYGWMRANLPEIVNRAADLENIINSHDSSKADPDEYEAYDAYFHGNNRTYAVLENFRFAWLRHIHHNPHHWQYWVLNDDDPNKGEILMDIPYEYIIEMICDWWSFSWRGGDLTEIFRWYEEHGPYIKLSTRTRATVEHILKSIKEKLEELDD